MVAVTTAAGGHASPNVLLLPDQHPEDNRVLLELGPEQDLPVLLRRVPLPVHHHDQEGNCRTVPPLYRSHRHLEDAKLEIPTDSSAPGSSPALSVYRLVSARWLEQAPRTTRLQHFLEEHLFHGDNPGLLRASGQGRKYRRYYAHSPFLQEVSRNLDCIEPEEPAPV